MAGWHESSLEMDDGCPQGATPHPSALEHLPGVGIESGTQILPSPGILASQVLSGALPWKFSGRHFKMETPYFPQVPTSPGRWSSEASQASPLKSAAVGLGPRALNL